MYYTRFNTRNWEIILVGNEEGLSYLHMNIENGKVETHVSQDWVLNHAFFEDIIGQIKGYFNGERKTFDIKLNPKGTAFQKRVWEALLKIDYGMTVSYKQIAINIGNDKAFRAVGMANNKNPIPIIIPCHRVIGKNGKLTGYALGLDIKEELLNHERLYN